MISVEGWEEAFSWSKLVELVTVSKRLVRLFTIYSLSPPTVNQFGRTPIWENEKWTTPTCLGRTYGDDMFAAGQKV